MKVKHSCPTSVGTMRTATSCGFPVGTLSTILPRAPPPVPPELGLATLILLVSASNAWTGCPENASRGCPPLDVRALLRCLLPLLLDRLGCGRRVGSIPSPNPAFSSKVAASASSAPRGDGFACERRPSGMDGGTSRRTTTGALRMDVLFAYSRVLFESSKCSRPGCTFAIMETSPPLMRELLSSSVSFESRYGGFRCGVFAPSRPSLLFSVPLVLSPSALMQLANASKDWLIFAPSLKAAPTFCV
mmetsp:Transcript_36420/g.83677  ORF Transcript_36420/g.83677 Transcript_36420/m.83677 type:complete len:246 (-) Transcript_36420:976-1713(-)